MKREITLIDRTLTTVALTLWGDVAKVRKMPFLSTLHRSNGTTRKSGHLPGFSLVVSDGMNGILAELPRRAWTGDRHQGRGCQGVQWYALGWSVLDL